MKSNTRADINCIRGYLIHLLVGVALSLHLWITHWYTCTQSDNEQGCYHLQRTIQCYRATYCYTAHPFHTASDKSLKHGCALDRHTQNYVLDRRSHNQYTARYMYTVSKGLVNAVCMPMGGCALNAAYHRYMYLLFRHVDFGAHRGVKSSGFSSPLRSPEEK